MKKALGFLLIAIAMVFVLGAACPATAQISILVDASRDTGAWWFPQWDHFDPALPHQGKPLAEYLRAKGASVTELPRPEPVSPQSISITCQLLSQFHLVIAATEWNAYSDSELNAYKGYVAAGGRLVLLSEYEDIALTGRPLPNTLANAFGLDFHLKLTEYITSFTPHPITAGVSSLLYQAGSAATAAPASALFLAFASGYPVMGITPYGSGLIFFMGDTYAIEDVAGSARFIDNLMAFMLSGARQGNPAACAISALIVQVQNLGLNAGVANSLIQKLEAAYLALPKNNRSAANVLKAFINEIRALKQSRRLNPAVADSLIAAAQAIIDRL